MYHRVQTRDGIQLHLCWWGAGLQVPWRWSPDYLRHLQLLLLVVRLLPPLGLHSLWISSNSLCCKKEIIHLNTELFPFSLDYCHNCNDWILVLTENIKENRPSKEKLTLRNGGKGEGVLVKMEERGRGDRIPSYILKNKEPGQHLELQAWHEENTSWGDVALVQTRPVDVCDAGGLLHRPLGALCGLFNMVSTTIILILYIYRVSQKKQSRRFRVKFLTLSVELDQK